MMTTTVLLNWTFYNGRWIFVIFLLEAALPESDSTANSSCISSNPKGFSVSTAQYR
jgi:hypothetical protein